MRRLRYKHSRTLIVCYLGRSLIDLFSRQQAQSTEDKQHAMDDAQACAAAKQTVQGELESAINLAESEKRRNQQMISAFESKSRELDRMLAQLAEAHSYGRACNASKTKFQSECSKCVPLLFSVARFVWKRCCRMHQEIPGS